MWYKFPPVSNQGHHSHMICISHKWIKSTSHYSVHVTHFTGQYTVTLWQANVQQVKPWTSLHHEKYKYTKCKEEEFFCELKVRVKLYLRHLVYIIIQHILKKVLKAEWVLDHWKYLQPLWRNQTHVPNNYVSLQWSKVKWVMIQRKTSHQVWLTKESQYEITITVTSLVSQCRRGHSFSGAQGCEGNRKLQTPAPWEHEDCNQLARYPPLREEAPEREKGMGKWGGVKSN